MANPPTDTPVIEEDSVESLAAGVNQFVTFCTSLANAYPVATYIGDARLSSGVVAGIADPKLYNNSVRQASFIAAALAQFVANSGATVNDDGNQANFVTNLTNAIKLATALLNGSVTNALLANMPANTAKANITAAPAAPQDVTFLLGANILRVGNVLAQWGTINCTGATTPVALPNPYANANYAILYGAWMGAALGQIPNTTTAPAPTVNGFSIDLSAAGSGTASGNVSWLTVGVGA